MCFESYKTGLDRGLNVLDQQNFQAPGDVGDAPQCERRSQRQRRRTGFVGFGDGEGVCRASAVCRAHWFPAQYSSRQLQAPAELLTETCLVDANDTPDFEDFLF